jgi:YVTN family beta-propeller protein
MVNGTISPTRLAIIAAGIVLLMVCLSGMAWAKGYVYITYYDSHAQVVDAANYSLSRTFYTDGHSQFTASHDGRWLFMAGGHNIWKINNTADPGSSLNKTIRYNAPSATVRDIVVDEDNHIYLAEAGRYVEAYDGNTGEWTGRRLWTTSSPYRLALSPDGETLFVAGCLDSGASIFDTPDYNISAYDADTFAHLRTLRVDMAVIDIAISPDGSSLYVLGKNSSTGSKKTKLLKLRASDLTIQRTGFGTGSRPYDMVVSPDGDRVYVCEKTDDSIQVFDGNTLVRERTVVVGENPRYIDISSNGKKIYIVGENDQFGIVNTDTYTVTHTLLGSPALPVDIEYVDVGPTTFVWTNLSFATATPRPTIAMIANMTMGSATPSPSASSTATPSSPAATPGSSASTDPASASASPEPAAASVTPSPAASSGVSSGATGGALPLATPGFAVQAVAAGIGIATYAFSVQRRRKI